MSTKLYRNPLLTPNFLHGDLPGVEVPNIDTDNAVLTIEDSDANRPDFYEALRAELPAGGTAQVYSRLANTMALLLNAKPAYMLAPTTTSSPLANVGTLGSAVPNATAKNGATLEAGVVPGTAAIGLNGSNQYIDTNWPTRTNDCANPYAAVNAAKWTASVAGALTLGGFEAVSDWGLKADDTIGSGGRSFRVFGTTTGTTACAFNVSSPTGTSAVPTVPGTQVTLSAYFKTIDPSITLGEGYALRIMFYKASGVLIENKESSKTPDEGVDGLRISFTATAPAETAFYGITIRASSVANSGDLIDFRFTAVLSEQSATLNEYFPKPTRLTSGLDSFVGTAHESACDTGPFARKSNRTFIGMANHVASAGYDEFMGGSLQPPYFGLGNESQTVVWSADGVESETYAAAWPGYSVGAMFGGAFDNTNDKFRLAVNGVALTENAHTVDFKANAGTLIIGAGGGVTSFLKGQMLPFAVFTKALSNAELAALTVIQ